MNQLRPEGMNYTGTTSNGRFVVTVTSTSVDRALEEMQLRLPDTTKEHVLDPDFWMRRYGAPDTIYDAVYDRGIECTIVRRSSHDTYPDREHQHHVSGDSQPQPASHCRDELSA